MNEYITKQQAIEAFDSPAVEWYYGDVCPESVIHVIESLPAANVRSVKRGKWINYGDEYHLDIKCCICGQRKPILLDNFNFNYCPNCGANMKEES